MRRRARGRPLWEEQVGKKERDMGRELQIRHGRDGNPRRGGGKEDLKFQRRCYDLPGSCVSVEIGPTRP
jgi:hypothetical protein